MDLFDFIPIVPPGSPRSSDRSTAEEIGAALALMILPAIDACIVLFAKIDAGMTVAVWLPVGFAALAYVLCRLLDTNVPWAIVRALGCAALCCVCGLAAGLVNAFFSFF
jgi:hypothetical protein